MNQESFRRLLETPRSSTRSSHPRGIVSTSRSRLVVQSKQKSVVEKPAFKPRNIKKSEDVKPQDQTVNVNTNLNASNIEPPATKGLDFALLEKEREKIGLPLTNDMDDLEQAFAESSALQNTEQLAPRKRTRDDLIRKLKEMRSTDGGTEPTKADTQLEKAKQEGKFKPIGLTSTSKRRKEGVINTDRKKKRKVDMKGNDIQTKHLASSIADLTQTRVTSEQNGPTVDEGLNDDFDIFADVEEYTGVDFDENAQISSHPAEEPPSSGRWIATDEPKNRDIAQTKSQLSTQLPVPIPEDTKAPAEPEVDERPMRLVPLESSAIPSVKELLELHDSADKHDKRMKRKDKNKRKRGGGGKGNDSDVE